MGVCVCVTSCKAFCLCTYSADKFATVAKTPQFKTSARTRCRWLVSVRRTSTWTRTATTSAVSSVVMPRAGVCHTTARHSHVVSSLTWLVQGSVKVASSAFISTRGSVDSHSTRIADLSVRYIPLFISPCLEAKGECYQNCSIPCCVRQLCTTVCTQI